MIDVKAGDLVMVTVSKEYRLNGAPTRLAKVSQTGAMLSVYFKGNSKPFRIMPSAVVKNLGRPASGSRWAPREATP